MKYISWKYPFLTCLVMILLLSRDGLAIGRMGLLAALLHEAGHAWAYFLLMGRLPRISISPAGIGMEAPQSDFTPRELLILAAAGPAVNLALGGLCFLAMQIQASYGGYWFGGVNLWMGLFNLIPVGRLDGARIRQALEEMGQGY